MTATGAVPFENGTAGVITQDPGFTYDGVNHRLTAGGVNDQLTVGTLSAGYSGLWTRTSAPGAANYTFLGDGVSSYFNAASDGLYFRLGNADVLRVLPGTMTLQIPALAAKTGTRYICVDTSGNLVSQRTACSGT